MQTFDIGQVLVTCGAEGAWLVQRDGEEASLKPPDRAIEVVDTVGAGDGFSAVFILGKLRGWPVAQTLARAHAFAAAICTIRGAAPAHADFYEPFLKAWRS
jgi:fructokinase